MVRPTQFLHPSRTPAPLWNAATVLLLRDGAHGLEVLMTRRSMQASFAPGAYVFPGGGIDETDTAAHPLARRRPTQDDTRLTQAIAAIRESFEELGVLLARRADGGMVHAQDMQGLDRHASLFDQCRARGWQLAADDVFVLAHWITDRDLPRRFDVPFLAARMPADQTPVADEKEQFEPVWVRPADALERHRAGHFFMIFPTIRTLERMQAYASVDAALAACASEQPLFVSCPRAGFLAGKDSRHMESDLPFGELALVCPDGQIVHHLDWQHTQPVPLLRHVQRLTAPNPGMMTGPGTNSYVVGDADTGYVVIDAGPADAEHVQRLWEATGGRIHSLICTHSHPDHAPGARLLQALCERHGHKPPILGLPSGSSARATSHFSPDRVLADGECLVLQGQSLRHSLRVLHTPGHAANHVCLVLEEDGLLFSGDHVLNGSTTVIDPPDGHMGAYLQSLDKLLAACAEHRIGFILPAHGYVMGNWGDEPCNATEHIRRLKEHRLRREAKIARIMQELPQASMEEWLSRAYDDVPAAVRPVAMRSLLAHVEHLQSP